MRGDRVFFGENYFTSQMVHDFAANIFIPSGISIYDSGNHISSPSLIVTLFITWKQDKYVRY
jgi:hypothetical protein